VFDWCANGQKLKCLTVTDEWTKEGLAIEVDGRIRSARVIEVLSRLVSKRGAPLYLRSDNVLRQEVGHSERQQISLRRS
jgi:putative transposase